MNLVYDTAVLFTSQNDNIEYMGMKYLAIIRV